jgi:hypothetical protein
MLVSTPALAGGVGIIGNAGFHTEDVYWYSSQTLDDGQQIENEANYEQIRQRQSLFNGGGGLEFLLGDRDDRVQGVFRLYYNMDAAQADPASRTTLVPEEAVVANIRDSVRHIGMASVGLSWGVIGNPDGFQLGLSAHAGSGFLTNDRTEFLMAQIGPTASYRVGRQVVLFGDVQYAMRFRKELSNGALVTLGARYMFD